MGEGGYVQAKEYMKILLERSIETSIFKICMKREVMREVLIKILILLKIKVDCIIKIFNNAKRNK